MSIRSLDRRRFMQGAGAAGLAAAGVSGLAACDTADPGGGQPSTQTPAEGIMPTFQKFDGVIPDLPGDGEAVPDGFLSYPNDVVTAIDDKPGDGSTIVAVTQWTSQVPPAMGQNKYWQALNDRLGVTMDYQSSPASDYVAKASTVLAGGDLPDVLQIPVETPNLPDVLRARFADLSPYLSGDGILDYPFLANLPAHVWEQSIYNGGIYGVRYPLHPYGSFLLTNRGLLSDLGLSIDDVTDAESFSDLCREVTDPSSNRWALMNPNWLTNFVSEMTGKPHFTQLHWHEEGGKFTYARETEEYRQALEFVVALWEDGVFHPDSLALSGADEISEFVAGRSVFDYRGGNQWARRVTTDGVDTTALPPVSFSGGGGLGAKALSWGTWTMAAINGENDPDRVQMILRVMNWLAAPIGTAEYEFRVYGESGTHHTVGTDGWPQLTETGDVEVKVPNVYVAAPAPILQSSDPEVTTEWHGFVERVAAVGMTDAALGLWSQTSDEKWTRLEQDLEEAIGDIFRGQKTIADFDSALDDWRSNGGDTMRGEYEAAFEERANG